MVPPERDDAVLRHVRPHLVARPQRRWRAGERGGAGAQLRLGGGGALGALVPRPVAPPREVKDVTARVGAEHRERWHRPLGRRAVDCGAIGSRRLTPRIALVVDFLRGVAAVPRGANKLLLCPRVLPYLRRERAERRSARVEEVPARVEGEPAAAQGQHHRRVRRRCEPVNLEQLGAGGHKRRRAHVLREPVLDARRRVHRRPLHQVDEQYALVEAAAARREVRRAQHLQLARVDGALDAVRAVHDGAERQPVQRLVPQRLQVGTHDRVGVEPDEPSQLREELRQVDHRPLVEGRVERLDQIPLSADGRIHEPSHAGPDLSLHVVGRHAEDAQRQLREQRLKHGQLRMQLRRCNDVEDERTVIDGVRQRRVDHAEQSQRRPLLGGDADVQRVAERPAYSHRWLQRRLRADGRAQASDQVDWHGEQSERGRREQ